MAGGLLAGGDVTSFLLRYRETVASVPIGGWLNPVSADSIRVSQQRPRELLLAPFFSLLLLLSLNSTLRARSDVLFLIHRSTDRGCWVKTQNENHGKPDIEKERNRKKKTMYGTTLEICMEGSWLDIDCEHVLKWSIVSYRVSGPYRVGRRVTLSASEPATMTSPTLRCVASDWMTHLANEVSPSAIEGCGARVSLPSTPISIRCAHHAS